MPDKDDKIIKASPTKEFFIYMLTRDIPLIRAILDLADNSVDGATSQVTEDDYSQYWIRIECCREHFKIIDNCGGIPIKTAQNYAFRFGRPKEVEMTPGSIGKFGVGMKRSFFKIGNNFKVLSKTSNSEFLIDQDVRSWIEKPNNWNFKFKEKHQGISVKKSDIGTTIEIKELFENVAESFDLELFRNELRQELETAYTIVMKKGFSISLNGEPIGFKPLSLLKSDKLEPGFFEKNYTINDKHVNVKVYAGVAGRNIEEAGWYVFCNGRMVLESDQSEMTTWGSKNNMPKFHADLAYFRGYVFFDSDDAELLPWTTTKTGVDVDSIVYKSVQAEMINLMRPVLDYLRKLADERSKVKKGEIEKSYLDEIYKETKPTSYQEITEKRVFSAPESPPMRKLPRLGSIQYNKSYDDIKKLKRSLRVSSNKAVGEKTFDYYLKMECEDE